MAAPSSTPTPLAPQLWSTSGFGFDSMDDAARRAVRPRVADFYTRLGNPTVQAFADAVAELEGAEAAICSASGMGAISTIVLGLCSAGDHIVTQNQLFTSTRQLFASVCPRFGIDVTFVDVADGQAWLDAVEPGRTKLIFTESPANPTLELADLAALGDLAALSGVVTAVDSTLATPLGQRPLDHGIDLVVHSATKALAGHNDATLGVIAGEKTLIGELWSYAIVAGACASPYDSWNALRGLKTLALRVARQTESARALAAMLHGNRRVRRVFHPCFASPDQQRIATRQLRDTGGLVSFDLHGDEAAVHELTQRLTIPLVAPSLGGPETLVNHPASMTHAALTPHQREVAGVTPGLVRVSLGLEPTEEILADFSQALA